MYLFCSISNIYLFVCIYYFLFLVTIFFRLVRQELWSGPFHFPPLSYVTEIVPMMMYFTACSQRLIHPIKYGFTKLCLNWQICPKTGTTVGQSFVVYFLWFSIKSWTCTSIFHRFLCEDILICPIYFPKDRL